MVLQSGNAPYDYSVADPLKVRNPYTNIGLQGPSGIFLEQAQFVITAELRKFNAINESHILPDFNVYVNPVITPSGPYEPKVNGSTLGNALNPGNLFIINHILETRTALDELFSFYELEGELFAEEHQLDWLNQVAIDLPFPSGYRRYDPGTTDQQLATADVNTLGGSGVLFDIDFAEVMFNPYPFFSHNIFLNIFAHSNFPILVNAPVWPCFQHTDGSFVGLNGREPSNARDGISTEYDLSHFAAHEVRLDGYVFLPQTDYLIGRGLYDFTIDGSFTYVSSSPRTAGDGAVIPTTRVFASTQALASGIYKVAARNRRVAVPFTTVESGIISQWPASGQAYPGVGRSFPHVIDVISPFNGHSVWYNNQEYDHGYQVFDDALWITDASNSSRPPSGLIIASPFTGHAMWLRFAELALSTGKGSQGGANMSSGVWGEHVGLYKLGSTIYRVQRSQANGTTSALHRALIQTYDEDLTYLGQIEGPDAGPAPGTPRFYTDMTFLPSRNEWILYGNDAGGRLSVTFYNSDFSSYIRTNGAFYIGADGQTPGNAISQTSTMIGVGELDGVPRSPGEFSDGNGGGASFHTRGSGIWDLEIGTAGSGVIFKDCRVIDMSKVSKQWSSTLGAKIYDLFEVPPAANHIHPGSYALIGFDASSFGSSRLFLVRIQARNDPTAPGFCVGFWDVLATYDLGTIQFSPSPSINSVPNMLYQTIN